MRRFFGVAVIAALLAGCGAPGAPPPSLGQRSNATFVRQVAGPDTYLGQMPTAVVLMKSGNPGRDTAFCQEFIKLKTAQGALAEATFAPNIILTRWPVRPSTTTAVRPDDCADLVDNYDFARAANLMAGIRLTSGNFNGRGPFLMIIDGGKIAAVDGSRYTDFATFVGQWQTAVTRMQDQVTAARPTGRGLFGFLWSAIKSILSSIFPPVQGVIMIVEGVLQDMVCP